MERTPIGSLRQQIGETVKIQGWLETLRDQKKMQFLILRDRTGLVQVALWRANNPELADQISKLNVESALTITGKVVDNPIVKLGGLEIQLDTLTVENLAETPLPFDPFDKENLPAIDFRMDWRYLDLRRGENLLLFKVRTALEEAMRAFEEGVQLVRVCHRKLDEVEKRVELLLKDDAGRFFTRPFPEDENSGAS